MLLEQIEGNCLFVRSFKNEQNEKIVHQSNIFRCFLVKKSSTRDRSGQSRYIYTNLQQITADHSITASSLYSISPLRNSDVNDPALSNK